MSDFDTLTKLYSEYRDIVAVVGTLLVREAPRIWRWSLAAARYTGRFAYSCVTTPDSDIVKAVLNAVANGGVNLELDTIACGPYHIAVSRQNAAGNKIVAAKVCHSGVDVTAGLTNKEHARIAKAARLRIEEVAKLKADREAKAARRMLEENLRGNA